MKNKEAKNGNEYGPHNILTRVDEETQQRRMRGMYYLDGLAKYCINQNAFYDSGQHKSP